MPILPAEPDHYPDSLFNRADLADSIWWLLYTKSRQEKQLMRLLRDRGLSHYGPQIPQRNRSSAGRVRTSYIPLFRNYVFLCGDNDARFQAVSTGCVQDAQRIERASDLVNELIQIKDLIGMNVPLSLEERIQSGQRVRVKNGAFAGYEGQVLRRTQETRLLVSVQFMEQGVSVKLDDCQLEPI